MVSFNRAPERPEFYILQTVLMTITSPFQSGLTSTTGFFKGLYQTYFSLKDSRVDNDRLRADRQILEKKIMDLSEELKELKQVEGLKEWHSEGAYQSAPAVLARVVGRDANELFNTVIINKGASSGILKDQPVVTAEGLVGRVIFTTSFSSRVLLLTDERHGTGAVIGQTVENRLLGVVKGKSEYICEMRFIAPPGKVENGEPVITSGQDGIYPKGLLIGRVRMPETASNVVPQVLAVEPAAPLSKLETVSVLLISPEQIRLANNEVVAEEKKLARPAERRRQ